MVCAGFNNVYAYSLISGYDRIFWTFKPFSIIFIIIHQFWDYLTEAKPQQDLSKETKPK